MDPLLHTQDEETVKTVDFTGRTNSEKGEDIKSAGKMMTTVFGMHAV